MANTIVNIKQHVGANLGVRDAFHFTLESDGTEETALAIYDPADYRADAGARGTKTIIESIVITNGSSTGSLKILWDATTDVLAVSTYIYNAPSVDFCNIGGLRPPDVAGLTGKLLLTTANVEAGDSFTCTVVVKNVK